MDELAPDERLAAFSISTPPLVKPPRKPRPSEIAAKLAKAKAKTEKTKKLKAKNQRSLKHKTRTLVDRQKTKRKAIRKGRPLVRTCRMDIRLAPKELAKLKRIAKAKDISATAMLVRLIEKAA
jgi:hypothetical protein